MRSLAAIVTVLAFATTPCFAAPAKRKPVPPRLKPMVFNVANAGRTEFVLLTQGATGLSFYDVYALLKPNADTSVTRVAIDGPASGPARIMAMARAKAAKTVVIVNPFRIRTGNVVSNVGAATIRIAGETQSRDNPDYDSAVAAVERAETKLAQARAALDQMSSYAQSNATDDASRMIGAAGIMGQGINASNAQRELDAARRRLAGTPQSVSVTLTESVSVPQVTMTQIVEGEIGMIACDVTAGVCARTALPQTRKSRDVEFSAVVLHEDPSHDGLIDRLTAYPDDLKRWSDANTAFDGSPSALLAAFDGMTFATSPASTFNAEVAANTAFRDQPNSELTHGEALAQQVKARLQYLRRPFDDPLGFAKYGEEASEPASQ